MTSQEASSYSADDDRPSKEIIDESADSAKKKGQELQVYTTDCTRF